MLEQWSEQMLALYPEVTTSTIKIHLKELISEAQAGASGWQPMILRGTLDVKRVWQKDRRRLGQASPPPAPGNNGIPTLRAWLGQSPRRVYRQWKKQKQEKKKNHSTVHWETTHTFTYTAEQKNRIQLTPREATGVNVLSSYLLIKQQHYHA